jgi:uncharacterized protein YhbP (UPF0306 family)
VTAHLAETGRRIVDSSMYLTLATADEDGRPWASPVWFARAAYSELFWVSNPEARHSRNLAGRPEVAIVIFDSTMPVGHGEAVYLEARAEELRGTALEDGLAIYSRRSQQVGAGEWTLADVSPPSHLRLYRATASEAFVLDSRDQRVAVTLDEAR